MMFQILVSDRLQILYLQHHVGNERFSDKDNQPELIIEPGSALVGDCMKFVGTVKTIKNIRGKSFATVLGSQKNISMTGVNPPIEIINMSNEQDEYKDLDFVGFTCIESDVIYRNFNGKLAINDAITTGNCNNDEAKIIGITPAVLTFKGIFDCCPPTCLLPCTFCDI